MKMSMRLTTYFSVILLFSISMSGVGAQPYTPQTADEVVAQLPFSTDPDMIKLRQLRQKLSQQPQQLSLALTFSHAALILAQRYADPRFYGYIKAALKPWWQQTQMTPDVLEVMLLRAIIAQSRHRFQSALIDLETVLKQQPDHVYAWLVKALILQTQGQYQQAKQACAKIIFIADHLTSTLCAVQVTSVSGQAKKGQQLLLTLLQQSVQAPSRLQVWGWTLLAEISHRLNQPKLAEQYFKQALKIDGKDHYLNVAYADFLLQMQRYQDIVQRYKLPLSTALLVRLALAEKALAKPIFVRHQSYLAQRFATAKQQNDMHWRDYALFLLLKEQPKQALAAALTNWQSQRQPEDSVLVLKMALAAKQPKEAIQTVINWLKQQQLEDYRIQPMIQALQAQ